MKRIVAFLLLYFSVGYLAADNLPKDYLWLEYGEREKEKNGSVTQHIFLFYGNKNHKLPLSSLKQLQCSFSNKINCNPSKDSLFVFDINIQDSIGHIRINRFGSHVFNIYATGTRHFDSSFFVYSAHSSFTLFGKMDKANDSLYKTVAEPKAFPLEIQVFPTYSYWRETEKPLTFTLQWNGKQIYNQALLIVDENTGSTSAKRDSSYHYLPASDKKIRSGSIVQHKHLILLTQKTNADKTYIATRTLLLHRSRHGFFSLQNGLILFGISLIITFIIIKRRRHDRF